MTFASLPFVFTILEPANPHQHKMVEVHRNPFEYMKINDYGFLNAISGRSPCIKCLKSRKFFCYTCYVPTQEVQNSLPKIKLPIKIDIIKHQREVDGKSTAIHAAILAPDDVKIYTYPDIPDYRTMTNGTVLIFPTPDSVHVNGIFNDQSHLQAFEQLELPRGYNKGTLLKFHLDEIDETEREDSLQTKYDETNLPIKRAVFIDSTWNQSKSIFKDNRIRTLRTVVLQHRLSQFWRHQRGCPRWFLATIEAIHQLLLEIHVNAWGMCRTYEPALKSLEIDYSFIKESWIVDQPMIEVDEANAYNGQYDNLLFFFSYIYQLIHKYYDENNDRAGRRPIK